jgi:hypothetical protein
MQRYDYQHGSSLQISHTVTQGQLGDLLHKHIETTEDFSENKVNQLGPQMAVVNVAHHMITRMTWELLGATALYTLWLSPMPQCQH